MLVFKILFPAKIHIVNKYGDIGIITLWSRPKLVIKWLGQNGIDTSFLTSRVAVIGNLYGNGLPIMLRNLLYNPQINYLLVLGQNLSGSKEELVNFFDYGLEKTEYLGTKAHRIIGTNRIIDDMINPFDFKNNLKVFGFGTLTEISTEYRLKRFFATLSPQKECTIERKEVLMPEIKIQRFPSDPRDHNILKPTPLEAYQELIFRLVRFGYRNQLKKGERIELQNIKAVISDPIFETKEALEEYGFSLELLQEYQCKILDSQLNDNYYSYGNRLRCYFQLDAMEKVVDILKKDINSRHAYISLWNTGNDLNADHGVPCLVSVYFRYFDGKLTLTATFRTHNALSAWLMNVYGLMALQSFVSDRIGTPNGAITVFSQSIGIDASMLENAKMVASSAFKRDLEVDPNGNFIVTIDRDTKEIIVEHHFNGTKIDEYRGHSAQEIERKLSEAKAVSRVDHAMYLGREIYKNERNLECLI